MLTIRNLVKIYPGAPPVTALYGVDLTVDRGMFGLLGPNGAGKSTLMRIIAGIQEATSGTLTFQPRDGEPVIDVLTQPSRLWPILGFLPQEFGFYPHLTGAQMLDFLLTLKGVAAPGHSRKALVGELLERVNLSHAARQRVKGYSGGMKQRLAIAQALAGDPQLLIVDEPTAGLDPEERHRFYRLLAELAADRTVVLSTHIVEDVAVLCSRFAIVREGRIVAESTPAAARAALEGTIFEGKADFELYGYLRHRFCITQSSLFEGVNQVRIYNPDRTIPSPGFVAVPPTLEDAYLATTLRSNPASASASPQSQPLPPPPPTAPSVIPQAAAENAWATRTVATAPIPMPWEEAKAPPPDTPAPVEPPVVVVEPSAPADPPATPDARKFDWDL